MRPLSRLALERVKSAALLARRMVVTRGCQEGSSASRASGVEPGGHTFCQELEEVVHGVTEGACGEGAFGTFEAGSGRGWNGGWERLRLSGMRAMVFAWPAAMVSRMPRLDLRLGLRHLDEVFGRGKFRVREVASGEDGFGGGPGCVKQAVLRDSVFAVLVAFRAGEEVELFAGAGAGDVEEAFALGGLASKVD